MYFLTDLYAIRLFIAHDLCYNRFFTYIFPNSKLLDRNVLYPDYTMAITKEWWKEALNRFINTNQVIRFDGVFLVS